MQWLYENIENNFNYLLKISNNLNQVGVNKLKVLILSKNLIFMQN